MGLSQLMMPRVAMAALLGAAAILPASTAVAQTGTFPLTSAKSPRYALDATQEIDADGKTSVRLAFQVPFTELQFVRVPAGYGAAVEFLLVVRDDKGRETGGDVWEERFVVATLEETKAPGTVLSSSRTLRLDAGKYRVKARVSDASSRRQAEVEGEFEVRGLGRDGLGLAAPAFGECSEDSGGVSQFLEIVSRRYVSALDRLCVRLRIFDTALEPDPYDVEYRIVDGSGDLSREGELRVPVASAKEFYLHPDARGLFLGTYHLQLEVRSGRRRTQTEAVFYVETLEAPRGSDWDVLVEAAGYFAGLDATRNLRSLESDAERERGWQEFWLRRDADPSTATNETLVEFVRRVRFANANFRGLGAGYKTDQGRVYIRYGAPDDIEERGALDASPPTLIWEYVALRKRFIFLDRQGFGRYELLSSEDL